MNDNFNTASAVPSQVAPSAAYPKTPEPEEAPADEPRDDDDDDEVTFDDDTMFDDDTGFVP